MPNKDRNKRSVRKARAAEREALEQAHITSGLASAEKSKAKSKKASENKDIKTASKTTPQTKSKPVKRNGIFTKIGNYFKSVKVEMHRVTWPTKQELVNWSLAVIAILIVFVIATALVDNGFVALISGFTGLRG